MSESVQVVIVTLVAAAALAVLLRPLLSREKPTSKPTGGCSSCGSAEAHGQHRPPDHNAGR